jgi:hypothetical protein
MPGISSVPAGADGLKVNILEYLTRLVLRLAIERELGQFVRILLVRFHSMTFSHCLEAIQFFVAAFITE